MLSAMSAAINLAAGLDAVPDDRTVAMGTARRHRVDRAFEAVEGHRAPRLRDPERLVVIIAADVARGHRILLDLDLSRQTGAPRPGFQRRPGRRRPLAWMRPGPVLG